MLERIKVFLEIHANRAAFFGLITERYPESSPEYALISSAYKTAKEAFREDMRKDGKRYFEHVRDVALILLYQRVYYANTIAGALLHDIIEDKPQWPESEVAREFNHQVASCVAWVSKPKLESCGNNKLLRDAKFYSRFPHMPRESSLIKIADRVHNLLDLWDLSDSDREEKIAQTLAHYIPLAEREVFMYHELMFLLGHEK